MTIRRTTSSTGTGYAKLPDELEPGMWLYHPKGNIYAQVLKLAGTRGKAREDEINETAKLNKWPASLTAERMELIPEDWYKQHRYVLGTTDRVDDVTGYIMRGTVLTTPLSVAELREQGYLWAGWNHTPKPIPVGGGFDRDNAGKRPTLADDPTIKETLRRTEKYVGILARLLENKTDGMTVLPPLHRRTT